MRSSNISNSLPLDSLNLQSLLLSLFSRHLLFLCGFPMFCVFCFPFCFCLLYLISHCTRHMFCPYCFGMESMPVYSLALSLPLSFTLSHFVWNNPHSWHGIFSVSVSNIFLAARTCSFTRTYVDLSNWLVGRLVGWLIVCAAVTTLQSRLDRISSTYVHIEKYQKLL